MPIVVPRLPPKNATEKRVASGIRQIFFLALCLSIPIKIKPNRLKKIKYDAMTIMTFTLIRSFKSLIVVYNINDINELLRCFATFAIL